MYLVQRRATVILLALVSFVLVACSGSSSPEPTSQPQAVTEGADVPVTPTEVATVAPVETRGPAPTVSAPLAATVEPETTEIAVSPTFTPVPTATLPPTAMQCTVSPPAPDTSLLADRELVHHRNMYLLVKGDVGDYSLSYQGYDAWQSDYWRMSVDEGRALREDVLLQVFTAVNDPGSEIGHTVRVVERACDALQPGLGTLVWWDHILGPMHLGRSTGRSQRAAAEGEFIQAISDYQAARISYPHLASFGDFLAATGYLDQYESHRDPKETPSPASSPRPSPTQAAESVPSSGVSVPTLIDANEFSGSDPGSIRVLPHDADLFSFEDDFLSVSIPSGEEEYFWAYSSETTDLQDGAVTARIYLDGTDAGGVLGRAAFDAEGNLVDVYACLIRSAPAGRGFGCYRRGDYEWTMLASQDTDAVTPDAWNNVEFHVTGSGVEFLINGQRVFSWRDSEPLDSGYWGAYLRRYNGSTGSSITYDFIRIHEYQ